MGQSPSIPSEHASLIFSSNSLRNTQIECDALGIHYRLSTPTNGIKTQRLTSITRWDPRQEKDVLIAEWERKVFGKDRIRVASNRELISGGSGSEDGFVLVKEFLERTSGLAGTVRVDRTFSANNGKCYTWKARHDSLKLYEEGRELPIAEYDRKHYFINKREARIRLGPGCDEILDYIIVTCVITERKKRDAEAAERSSG